MSKLPFKEKQLAHLGYDKRLRPPLSGWVLARLEEFVFQVLSDDDPPFIKFYEQGRLSYKPSALVEDYFDHIHDFIEVTRLLSARYQYSERINVFVLAYQTLQQRLATEPLNPLDATEQFDFLVRSIRQHWKTQNFQAKLNARTHEAKRRYREYCLYIDRLFDKYARLVVLRLDLFYQKTDRQEINVTTLSKDFNHLLDNQRCNGLFDAMTGYIAKLEYGIDKGLHYHLILFFDGSKRNGSSHIHLAKKIGDYWVDVITEGRGAYWNCNKQIKLYEKQGRRGIGVIHYHETQLIKNLKSVINYLCKTTQYIKPIFGSKVRLLRRGLLPKSTDKKLGKPRKATLLKLTVCSEHKKEIYHNSQQMAGVNTPAQY